jgi:hypothetical protein
MAAHEHLNKQLFHGTNVPFVSGDVIVPMGDISQSWQDDFPETGNYAHATSDPVYAQVFAMRAHETLDGDIGDESKPRIFRVRPMSTVEPDPSDPKESFRDKKGFEVIDLHSEATPDDESYGGYRF